VEPRPTNRVARDRPPSLGGPGHVASRTKVLAASVVAVTLIIAVAVVDIAGTGPTGPVGLPSSDPVASGPTSPSTTPPTTVGSPTTAPAAPEPTVVRPAASSPFTLHRVISSAGSTTPISSSPSTTQGSSAENYASTAPDPPSANISADPNLVAACRSLNDEGGCINSTVLAIDNARADEGIGPMELPTDFAELTPSEQLFVMVDCERVDRGLTPIAGELTSLDQVAGTAAQDQSDPSVPPDGIADLAVAAWVGNWASTESEGDALYEWMYDDGLGSINIDCTAADESGCWIHRDNILGFQNDIDGFGGSLSFGGAAVVTTPARGQPLVSVTMLITWSPDTPTGYYYTWDQAVDDGAG
jgi:hypothetical protein